MPMYTLRCGRCEHSTEQGFTVSAFKAQTTQGFRFLRCKRCNRRGSLDHDFMADARSQVVHMDQFTFAENAPDDLAGKTFTRREAAAKLKERGLALSGKDGKKKSLSGTRSFTEQEIAKRWAEKNESAKKAPKAQETAAVAEAAPKRAPQKKEPSSDKKSLSLLKRANLAQNDGVDSDTLSQDTIAGTWPALKKQAKCLGIPIPRTMKRPELERLVRESIAN